MKLRHKSDEESNDLNAGRNDATAGTPAGERHGDDRDAARERGRVDVDAAATTTTGDDKGDDGPPPPDPDAGPDSPTKLKGKGIFAALKRTLKQFSQDNISDWAAALTYYGILSIFPAVLALVSVLGMLSDDGTETVRSTVGEVVPGRQS